MSIASLIEKARSLTQAIRNNETEYQAACAELVRKVEALNLREPDPLSPHYDANAHAQWHNRKEELLSQLRNEQVSSANHKARFGALGEFFRSVGCRIAVGIPLALAIAACAPQIGETLSKLSEERFAAAQGVTFIPAVDIPPPTPAAAQKRERQNAPVAAPTEIRKSESPEIQGIARFFQRLNDDLSRRESLKYARLVERTASDLGVRPTLMAAIIAQESRGNARATSGVAHGLMQVHQVHLKWAKKFFPDIRTKQDLYEPENNIPLGGAILKGYLKRAGGNLAKALRLYSGGAVGYAGKVQKWEAQVRDDVREVRDDLQSAAPDQEDVLMKI